MLLELGHVFVMQTATVAWNIDKLIILLLSIVLLSAFIQNEKYSTIFKQALVN